jgi:mono/diheme cytochrome c family protein
MTHPGLDGRPASAARSGPWASMLALAAFLATAGAARGDVPPEFDRDIRPIFKERCVSCHGPLKQKGGLRLDAGALVVQGGKQGPVVVPGRGGESDLIARLLSGDEGERMPPEGEPLSAEKIDLVRRWIDGGARYPKDEVIAKSPAGHWSFRPVGETPVPGVKDTAWVRNEIDAFVLARLEERGWKPAASASPGALLRRAYLDLTGLPPTPEEQEADRPLEAVIDDLLARPAYGERWARHWLDVVRYADSNGYERDSEKPFVWRYRDYVIDALNEDKPFGRFILEQIAGDELPDRDAGSMIATGFLRLGPWDDEPADTATDRFDQLDDIVSTVGQAFLGLSIGCARCHDHKFEPLSTRDYYGLVAVFDPLRRPQNGRSELTRSVGPAGNPAYIWDEPSPSVPETRVLLRGSPSRPGEVVRPAVPAILVEEQPEFPTPGERTTRRRLGLARWIASDDNPLTARVIVNRVWQQHFGQGLVRSANDFGLMGTPPTHPELLDWLARWFVRDAHGSLKKLHRLILTSNTWRMGKASVATYAADPEDLLLWRMPYRRLEVEPLRDAMLAASGQLNPERFGPAVKLPIPTAALEANADKQKIWQASDEKATSRRTIYAFVKRGLVVPMLEVLDLADTVSSCPQRQVTTVAPQALSLFNGEFVNRQARHFAARLEKEAGDDGRAQVRLAWRLALCREPGEAELARLLAFLEAQSRCLIEEATASHRALSEVDARRLALQQACRVILNLNEFAYPE